MTQRVNVQLWPEPLSPTTTWNEHALSGWGEARLGVRTAEVTLHQVRAGRGVESATVVRWGLPRRTPASPGSHTSAAHRKFLTGYLGVRCSLLVVGEVDDGGGVEGVAGVPGGLAGAEQGRGAGLGGGVAEGEAPVFAVAEVFDAA